MPVDPILTQHFDSLSKVSSLNAPALFMHGTADEVVPHEMSVGRGEQQPGMPRIERHLDAVDAQGQRIGEQTLGRDEARAVEAPQATVVGAPRGLVQRGEAAPCRGGGRVVRAGHATRTPTDERQAGREQRRGQDDGAEPAGTGRDSPLRQGAAGRLFETHLATGETHRTARCGSYDGSREMAPSVPSGIAGLSALVAVTAPVPATRS